MSGWARAVVEAVRLAEAHAAEQFKKGAHASDWILTDGDGALYVFFDRVAPADPPTWKLTAISRIDKRPKAGHA